MEHLGMGDAPGTEARSRCGMAECDLLLIQNGVKQPLLISPSSVELKNLQGGTGLYTEGNTI